MRTVTHNEFDYKRGVPVPALWRKDVDSKEILRLRQAGRSVKGIAAKFGIAKSTVCARLKNDFPEEYKKEHNSDFGPGWLWGYFLHRETEGPYWSQEGIIYFPRTPP